MNQLVGGLAGQAPQQQKHQPFEYDPVDAPKHYLQCGISPVEVIELWNLDFFLGNVVKYIGRAGKKYATEAERIAIGKHIELEDLKKARKYLDMKIELLEKGELRDSIVRGSARK